MTNQEINKAITDHLAGHMVCDIAEQLGWKSTVKQWFCSKDGGESGWLFDEYKEKCEEYLNNIKETDWRYGSTIHPSMSFPPKYCEDLNLMHEAEKTLTSIEQEEYWDFLWNLTGSKFELCHANARQRAEAFLKTVGKWEE
jgi:hypothetical protein